MFVIVETEKGLQYGKVTEKVKDFNSKDTFKDIVRVTTKEDYKKHLNNLKEADQALKKSQELADGLSLGMRFLSSSFTFDKKQLLLSFTADERVDFSNCRRRPGE